MAYFFGIDEPQNMRPLRGCSDDAIQMAKRFSNHQWNSPRYECHVKTDKQLAGLANPVKADDLRAAIDALFNPTRRLEVALFYFAGHGAKGGTEGNKHGFYLMTSDATRPEHGVAMSDVLDAANRCVHIQERIIVLDCCHSGHMGDLSVLDEEVTWLKEGVSVLAACRAEEIAVENTVQGGVFTRFILEALDGGAADVLGRSTLASIYAYVDLRLSLIQQRPVFKANVSRLVSLHACQPRIEETELRHGLVEFSHAHYHYPLDHSFEPDIAPTERKSPVDADHVKVFRLFQKMRSASLLEPVGGDHLYWAAYHEKACRLNSLGQLYWHASKIGKL